MPMRARRICDKPYLRSVIGAQQVHMQSGGYPFDSRRFGLTMKNIFARAGVLLLLAAALLPSRPAPAADGPTVARTLESVLRARVKSPGGAVEITVAPSPRAAQGYFSAIRISARPAQIKRFRFSALDLAARDVQVDVNKLLRDREIVTRRSDTRLRAVVNEADLKRMLAQGRSTATMGLRVKFLRDRTRVAGRWNWTWFHGPVVGVGKLRVAPQHRLYFDLSSLQLNGHEVPAALRQRFSERLNPLLDYSDLPFQPRFRAVRFNGASAVITAY
jgi:hypothetical protein